MDKISAEARSRNMSHIGGKNTTPEIFVRKSLSSLGLRYRIHYPLVGKPDIAFPTKKATVFIHGCFWHGHGCKNDHIPKSNSKYWHSKIETNKKRDKNVRKLLIKMGWKVFIIWECRVRTSRVTLPKKLLKLIA